MRELSICAFSLIGGREVNEDAVCQGRRGRRVVGVVADGLGGQGGGDVASRLAAEETLKILLEAKRLSPAALRDAMERVNSTVLAQQFASGCKMMTTLAVAAVEGRRVLLAHLGDTRVYRFRNGRLIYCSSDHSVTQKLADSGEITRDQMRDHETRNLLLKCLGQMETPAPETRQGWMLGNERLLLCTDGFWEKFSDGELARAMADSSVENILSGLKKTALERADAESDNISALLIG